MEKKNVNCPFCGYEKQIGADCPKCGRGGVILKVEDVVAGCRYHKPLSEHDSFDSAYEAACKLFDDGVWDDFLIDDISMSDCRLVSTDSLEADGLVETLEEVYAGLKKSLSDGGASDDFERK